jgi:hypothetical protein
MAEMSGNAAFLRFFEGKRFRAVDLQTERTRAAFHIRKK